MKRNTNIIALAVLKIYAIRYVGFVSDGDMSSPPFRLNLQLNMLFIII